MFFQPHQIPFGMCLIVFAWNLHPKYKLVLAANRDEFYHRPTAQAQFWPENPQMLGGKDLQAGGTWMAISKQGKFAAVTNYRDPLHISAQAASRGQIPTDFLNGNEAPSAFMESLHQRHGDYNGFNVLLSNLQEMGHYSNYENKINLLKPGIYGLSNAILDTPWPKVVLAKRKLSQLMSNSFDPKELLDLMTDTSIAPDDQLPHTGVPQEMERSLSAMCIRMQGYGTCCSTALTVDRDDLVTFTEKSFPVGSRTDNTQHFIFKLQ